MRRLVPFSVVPWLACLAAQAPTGPSLPRLLQLGPVPGNATTLELRADGSLARRSGGMVDLTGLDRILTDTTPAAELVLAIDRNTACAVVASVLDLARSKNVPRVHFAATLPDGQAGCFTLALPEGKESPTTIDLRLHRDRPGVPAESCVPLLQRLSRDPAHAALSAFVLGVEVTGDEPFVTLLQMLGAAARAGCERVVIHCSRTKEQQHADPAGFAAVAVASPTRAMSDLALDLGPSPTIHVPSRSWPHPRSTVSTAPFGCLDRAASGAGAEREDLADSKRSNPDNWFRRVQGTDGGHVDDDGTPDVEGTALVALMVLSDGSTLDAGPNCDVLRKVTGWLLARQRHDGRIPVARHGIVRQHALAMYALVEASGRSASGTLLRGGAQDALDWLFTQRQPDGGWHDGTPGAPSDTVSTACSLAAIAAAKFFAFGIAAEPAAVGEWFDRVSQPNGIHRMHQAAPLGHRTEATTTAAALLGRHFADQDPGQVPTMRAAAATLPDSADPLDPWCAFWTSHALFQIGGEPWRAWSKRLTDAVLKTQVRVGELKGSWEPAGGCSRLTTTALHVLTLTAYYRYSKLVR